MITTWRHELVVAMKEAGDEGPVVAVAPVDSDLDVPFDPGYGTSEGPDLLVWTDSHLYFPVVYDGSEWLGWAPRHPSTQGQPHVGGQ